MLKLPLPWFNIYSWSLLMACPPWSQIFRFCLKPSNQMLFNNIGFPTKGGHAICWHIHKERRKSCFAILFNNIETIDIGNWKFYKLWMHILLKRKTSLHMVIWSSAFRSWGNMLCICPNTNKKNFFLLLIINLLTMIQWVNKACICF